MHITKIGKALFTTDHEPAQSSTADNPATAQEQQSCTDSANLH